VGKELTLDGLQMIEKLERGRVPRRVPTWFYKTDRLRPNQDSARQIGNNFEMIKDRVINIVKCSSEIQRNKNSGHAPWSRVFRIAISVE
jgi:hypothetical protein